MLGDPVKKHLTEDFQRVRQLLTDLNPARGEIPAFRANSVAYC